MASLPQKPTTNNKRKQNWLTEGAIEKLANPQRSTLKDDPTLPKTLAFQILSLEAVQASATSEYLQLVLSDGTRSITGLIPDIDPARLRKEDSWVYRILHVRQWTVVFQPTPTLMIAQWNCDAAKIEDVIGNPTQLQNTSAHYAASLAPSSSSSSASASAAPPPRQQQQQQQQPFRPTQQQQQQQQPTTSPYFAAQQPQGPQSSPFYSQYSMSQTFRDPERLPNYFICDLNGTLNETWAVFARVIEKSEIKSFTTQTGRQGSVASVVLLDAKGERVRVSLFDNAMAVYAKLDVGTTYRIARGSIKPAKDSYAKQYNPLIAITFSESTTAREVIPSDPPEYCEIGTSAKLTFTRISAIIAKPEKSMINVLCVVMSVGDVFAFNSKAGRSLRKRELLLADSSAGQGKTITLTLWGENADKCAKFASGTVITVADTAVSDFNQKSLTGGKIQVVDGDTAGEHAEAVQELIQWWKQREGGADNTALPSLSVNSYSSAECIACGSLREVRERKLGMTEKPDTFIVKNCWVSQLSKNVIELQNAPTFKSCPGKASGDRRRHGISMTDDGGIVCVTCDRPYTGYNIQFLLKCQIMDLSGDVIWVTMFGDKANGFMTDRDGAPLQATTVQALYDGMSIDATHKKEYDDLLTRAINKAGTFRITGSHKDPQRHTPDFVVNSVEMTERPPLPTPMSHGLNGEEPMLGGVSDADMSGSWGQKAGWAGTAAADDDTEVFQ